MAVTTATGAGVPSTATAAVTRIAPVTKPGGATPRSITVAATARTTGRTTRRAAGTSASRSRAEAESTGPLARSQAGRYTRRVFRKEPAWTSANCVNG